MQREDWILAARDVLKDNGIDAVKIDRLAKMLNTTRNTFYQHFENRDALLEELLKHWDTNNTKAYQQTIDQSHDGVTELANIAQMWLEEKSFDAAYDIAVRNWARVSEAVSKAVKRSDRKRLRILETIFRDLGHENDQALVRARIAYYHQIGQLAVGLGESKKRRRELAPIFLEVLLGC